MVGDFKQNMADVTGGPVVLIGAGPTLDQTRGALDGIQGTKILTGMALGQAFGDHPIKADAVVFHKAGAAHKKGLEGFIEQKCGGDAEKFNEVCRTMTFYLTPQCDPEFVEFIKGTGAKIEEIDPLLSGSTAVTAAMACFIDEGVKDFQMFGVDGSNGHAVELGPVLDALNRDHQLLGVSVGEEHFICRAGFIDQARELLMLLEFNKDVALRVHGQSLNAALLNGPARKAVQVVDPAQPGAHRGFEFGLR